MDSFAALSSMQSEQLHPRVGPSSFALFSTHQEPVFLVAKTVSPVYSGGDYWRYNLQVSFDNYRKKACSSDQFSFRNCCSCFTIWELSKNYLYLFIFLYSIWILFARYQLILLNKDFEIIENIIDLPLPCLSWDRESTCYQLLSGQFNPD